MPIVSETGHDGPVVDRISSATPPAASPATKMSGGGTGTPATSLSIARRISPIPASTAVAFAQAVPDFLALRADGEALWIAARHPHLAAQSHHRRAHDHRLGQGVGGH